MIPGHNSRPISSGSLFEQGLANVRSGNFPEAVLILDQLIASAPDDARTHFLRGAVRAELYEFDAAVADLRITIRLDPGLWAAHFELGMLHYLRSDYPGAFAAWSMLDALPTSSSYRLFAQGLALLVAGRREEAMPVLDLGLRHSAENPALGTSMRKIIQGIQTGAPAAAEPAGEARHVLLNSYAELAKK